jgi:hypothetical protein
MATTVNFQRLVWEDYPSTDTPLSADNLNRLEEGVEGLYNDIEGSVLYFQKVPVSSGTGNIAVISSSSITPDHVVAECTWADQTAIKTDVTWTSASGTLTLNGECASATTANITLIKKMN